MKTLPQIWEALKESEHSKAQPLDDLIGPLLQTLRDHLFTRVVNSLVFFQISRIYIMCLNPIALIMAWSSTVKSVCNLYVIRNCSLDSIWGKYSYIQINQLCQSQQYSCSSHSSTYLILAQPSGTYVNDMVLLIRLYPSAYVYHMALHSSIYVYHIAPYPIFLEHSPNFINSTTYPILSLTNLPILGHLLRESNQQLIQLAMHVYHMITNFSLVLNLSSLEQ